MHRPAPRLRHGSPFHPQNAVVRALQGLRKNTAAPKETLVSLQALHLRWNMASAYNECMAAAANSPFRIVHTVCSHDCPDSCAVLVTVDSNGRAVRVQGDPTQPVTQGFLCGKVAKYLDRVYAPDRIVYPMKRKAGVPKGRLARG